MVDWLAGNRIRGTSTERTSATGFNSVTAVTGGWKEVARTTLGSNGTAVDVTSIPDKRYYMILSDLQASTGTINPYSFINNLGGSSYSTSFVANNGNLNSQFGVGYGNYTGYGTMSDPYFVVDYWANLSTQEKLGIRHVVLQDGSAAGNIPKRVIATPKVAFTGSVISSFKWTGGTFSSGDEVVVLGWDPDDTHTTNFWEELGTTTLDSSNANLEVTGLTKKKYLWVQAYGTGLSGAENPQVQLGDTSFDTGSSNYTNRQQDNGSPSSYDGTATQGGIVHNTTTIGTPFFVNMFIVNNQSKYKLCIMDWVTQFTAGSGYPPKRQEGVSKWNNSSVQISRVRINHQSRTLGSGSVIKVWGSN